MLCTVTNRNVIPTYYFTKSKYVRGQKLVTRTSSVTVPSNEVFRFLLKIYSSIKTHFPCCSSTRVLIPLFPYSSTISCQPLVPLMPLVLLISLHRAQFAMFVCSSTSSNHLFLSLILLALSISLHRPLKPVHQPKHYPLPFVY